jgi:hypothetical protein
MPAWIILGLAAAALIWLILRRIAARTPGKTPDKTPGKTRARIASGTPCQGSVPVIFTDTGGAKAKTTTHDDASGHEGGHEDGGGGAGD